MEDYIDKVVYIIIGIIVVVFNAINKSKKQQRKPEYETQTNLDEEIVFPPVKTIKKTPRENVVSLDNNLLSGSNKTQNVSTDKIEVKEDNILNEIRDFDIRTAVVYSEILNRKY